MQRFTIRVYGILINDQKQVLVSDEFIRGNYYTKFPGGGLELGEGTRDCLKREFKEEMDLEVEVGDHIYTTDYFQVSAFNPEHQIISIYYYAKALEEIKFSKNCLVMYQADTGEVEYLFTGFDEELLATLVVLTSIRPKLQQYLKLAVVITDQLRKSNSKGVQLYDEAIKFVRENLSQECSPPRATP